MHCVVVAAHRIAWRAPGLGGVWRQQAGQAVFKLDVMQLAPLPLRGIRPQLGAQLLHAVIQGLQQQRVAAPVRRRAKGGVRHGQLLQRLAGGQVAERRAAVRGHVQVRHPLDDLGQPEGVDRGGTRIRFHPVVPVLQHVQRVVHRRVGGVKRLGVAAQRTRWNRQVVVLQVLRLL
ncbi:hypothetical protein D3C87_1483890 [compost metagenome]